ncbi:hypothetical protein DpV83gp141 [Deerpox virus W-848-83]|uniref:Uncharacterized protein n=1 Tax=Deerpox virus (strain Mule deer/United States/W-848-83/1983) TaxID=305674 RepID=Q08FL1_DPV83|nr:hypothetical protein DpV83gp141 [Deerpox virus W-848-83]ABI99296.1 hypothetical protein DpV83gp141 [Deerpox virus W-848-83]
MEEYDNIAIKITSENGSTISVCCESKSKITIDIVTKKNQSVSTKSIIKKKKLENTKKDDEYNYNTDTEESENAMEIDCIKNS